MIKEGEGKTAREREGLRKNGKRPLQLYQRQQSVRSKIGFHLPKSSSLKADGVGPNVNFNGSLMSLLPSRDYPSPKVMPFIRNFTRFEKTEQEGTLVQDAKGLPKGLPSRREQRLQGRANVQKMTRKHRRLLHQMVSFCAHSLNCQGCAEGGKGQRTQV